jgi:hypothetical protein
MSDRRSGADGAAPIIAKAGAKHNGEAGPPGDPENRAPAAILV